MSPDDIVAENNHAAASKGATGLPLLGMTAGTDGTWSARFWEKSEHRKYERDWCEAVRISGQSLAVSFNDSLLPAVAPNRRQIRTVSAWGERIQRQISRLRIGVIGTGSVGSIIAESLARTGFSRVMLLDFDGIEELNLDRLLHAYPRDIGAAKVKVVARAMRRSAVADNFSVEPLELSVVEESGFRAALDCDLLFSCVDRPWPRHVLNFIAYAHLIPVIDGGVLARVGPAGRLRHADVRAHVAAPSRRCLQCLRQYDPADVSTERDGYLDKPDYIRGLAKHHHLRASENVFAFSQIAAGLEMSQLLSMIVAPSGLGNPGAQIYHLVTGGIDFEELSECNPNCIFRELEGRGDNSGIEVTGEHAIAERARRQLRTWSNWGKRFIRRLSTSDHQATILAYVSYFTLHEFSSPVISHLTPTT